MCSLLLRGPQRKASRMWKKQLRKLEVFNLRKKEELRVLYHLKRNFREEGIDLFCVIGKGETRIEG